MQESGEGFQDANSLDLSLGGQSNIWQRICI